MPSWSEFLLPHPDPHARTMRAPHSSPSANSHSHPHSPRHPPSNAHPNPQYAQSSPYSGIRHHLSAQGYLQPPPRSRYRPRSPPPGTASGSSSAQSSVQDLALRLVVSASGHETSQKGRARADSAVISSASCTSFSCASTRGKSSWQVVAEAFSARGTESEKRERRGKGKAQRKEKERSPPPRIGALAFEAEGQVSEPEEETEWENVTMEEAESSGVYDEGWRHDWGTKKIGLAISRSLLRSRSGDNLGRHNRYWSGRTGGGGSEEGTSSRGVGVGVGREGGTETPRATAQRRDVSNSKGKKIMIGPDDNADPVELIHHGLRGRGIGLDDAINGQRALAKSSTIKPPVISINGVELVGGVAGSPSSTNRRSSSKYGKEPSTANRPSPPHSKFLAGNIPTPSVLSSAYPSASSTPSSPAPNASEVSPANINKRKRRHRPDRACAVDDDTGLQCSVRSTAACSSSSSRSSAGSSSRSRNNKCSPVALAGGQGGRREAGMDGHTYGDTHAYVNGTVTSMHERGGKFKREVPGDRIIDNNVSVGVEDAAVDDGDIDSVIACDPHPLRDLTHNHYHHPRLPQQHEDCEDTPVVRSQPLPLASSSSTSPLQSSSPGSPLGSAPTPRCQSLGCSQSAPPSDDGSVQSSPSTPSLIHNSSSHPDGDLDMGLLNLGVAMTRTPSVSSPDARLHTAPTRVAQGTAPTLAVFVASTSSKTSERPKVAKKSSKCMSPESISLPPTWRPDVTADSQLRPPTTQLPPTLGTPRVVSPLEFDPATYFDSVSSASPSAALSLNASLPSSSSSSTSAPIRPVKLAQTDSGAWGPSKTVVEDDDGSDSDSEGGSHSVLEAKEPVNVEPPISPSVLASTTLELSEELTSATKSSTQTRLSFAPVAPLAIAKNPQSNQSGQKQKPASGSSPSVASLLARRFSFRSKSGGNLRGSYLQTSSPVASRPSSPSPLRNESFERTVEEVVSMLGNFPQASETSDSKEGSEISPASLPLSASLLEGNSTSGYPPNPPLSPSSSAAPSAWITQKLDLSRSPSNSHSSSISSVDTFFEFGTGMASNSGPSSSGSKISTPGTSPGPHLAAIAGPLGESLAKRWRRWSNNLGMWDPESQKVKEQQQDVGSNSNPGASGIPGANANTNTGLRQEQKLSGRSTSGECGVMGGAERGASKTGNTENSEATRDGLVAALSTLSGGTGTHDERVHTTSVSTSTDDSSATTTMPFSVSPSSATASVPTVTSRKLVKPRPSLRSASVDDQHHHDLQRTLSAEDGSAATSISSSRLHAKKPKFTLGDNSYASSDTPNSPKASSFFPRSTNDGHPVSAHGSVAGSIAADITTANGLVRRDTFRPPLIRRDAVVAPEQATRRWTLASAITDEAISDEGLLKELERIRVLSEWDRRRARAAAREKAKGKSVDRRSRTLSLDGADVLADAEGHGVHGGEKKDWAEQVDDDEEEGDEVQLWEIDVGVEIWEGRDGMLAREREREMARVVERQKLDRENEMADPDAASVSTGSSGHSPSSSSAENCTDTTPETTPALSPLATQPAPTWLAAQRALLICRELILTERRYLGLMRLLLDTHSPNASYAARYLSHSGMRTSSSASDIQALQHHYQGIQQQFQYYDSAATTTDSSLPIVIPSSSPQQTHVLVGPVPPMRMLAATVPLADTTMRFLHAMEGAPSVSGVAKAFVDYEAEMEEVYVAWCREVGAWFVDGPTDVAGSLSGGLQEIGRIPSPPGSTDGHTCHGHEDGSGDSLTNHFVAIPPPMPPLPGMPLYAGAVSANAPATPPTSPLKRVAGSWRRSMTSIPSLVGGSTSNGSIYGSNIQAHASERKREKERERGKEKEPLTTTGGSFAVMPVILGGGHALSPSGSSSANSGSGWLASRVAGSGSSVNAGARPSMEGQTTKPLRKLGVRDLAILPTQRVMRYVLLYRDLLAHTPATASSRVLVERALAVATRIADNCDRAQSHSAFFAPNNDSSAPTASSLNPNTKNSTSLAASTLGSGTNTGASASRSGSSTSSGGNTSGNGWRRKAKSRTRTVSLTAGPVPILGSLTPVRTSILQKT